MLNALHILCLLAGWHPWQTVLMILCIVASSSLINRLSFRYIGARRCTMFFKSHLGPYWFALGSAISADAARRVPLKAPTDDSTDAARSGQQSFAR